MSDPHDVLIRSSLPMIGAAAGGPVGALLGSFFASQVGDMQGIADEANQHFAVVDNISGGVWDSAGNLWDVGSVAGGLARRAHDRPEWVDQQSAQNSDRRLKYALLALGLVGGYMIFAR